MNIAAYLRVSSQEQDYSNQLQPVKDWCSAHWWPEPEIYAENESAWRSGHQKELSRILNDVRSGRRRFDYLVVFALDRLTRGGISECLQLVHSFELSGCKVVSVKESWIADSGPMRDLFAAFISWAAEYESTRKSQNTRAGQARMLKVGVTSTGRKVTQLGRPKGAKDKSQRHRAGYLNRWSKQTSGNNQARKVELVEVR